MSFESLSLGALVAILAAVLFGLHAVRTTVLQGPFTAYFAFLWFFSALLGSAGFTFVVKNAGYDIEVRYSTVVYTITFCALLLVYICEGIAQARTFIVISLLCQILFGSAQFFIFEVRGILGNPSAVETLFQPSGLRFFVSVVTAVFSLFFQVSFFQFLLNRMCGRFIWIAMVTSLAAAMALDSALYIALTRPETFFVRFLPSAGTKALITSALSVPLVAYLVWFQKHGSLDLKRGSLDIFKRIKNLEDDLKIANAELKRYAENLEKMVEDRTRVIQEKQAQIEKELKIASDIQAGTLPESLEGLSTAVKFFPCSSVSGDLYDFARYAPNQYYVLIADIQGHGVPAALVGSMCRMSLGRIRLATTQPAQVLGELSESLAPVAAGHYLTAVFATIDTENRELLYASGGHVAPLLFSQSGNHVWLETTGTLLGLGEGLTYGQKKIRYTPGARLIFYTDCVTEQKNEMREEFGTLKFLEVMRDSLKLSPQESANRIVDELKRFGGAFEDDLTLLILDLP